MKFILSTLFILILLAAIGAAATYRYMHTPNGLTADTTVIIRKGTGSQAIIEELGRAGVVRFPYVFFAAQYALGNTRQFKAGEYAFAAHMTPLAVAKKLMAGDVVIHKITIVEGWSVREIRAGLQAESVLEGEISRAMPEGSVLPETYHFTYGDTRDALVARMQKAMDEALENAWQTRASDLPLKSKEEALTLASIVEKETGVADERARVAAVFINRLRLGMRLQTDPSVIYGMVQQQNAPLERPLTRTDLEVPTAYNTYLISGLPPSPIACPSKAALLDTLHPQETNELYFVATGTGGHTFAKTLEEHNRNVAAYRAALANGVR